jgi:glycyl-tRNA synthetase beta chain
MSERLIVELLCEEIPVAEQRRFSEEAPGLFLTLLDAERVGFESLSSHTTPRRLTLVGEGIESMQEDLETELVGPPVAVAFSPDGQLTKAGESFLRKAGCGLDQTHRVDKGGKECLAAWLREKGGPSELVLSRILPQWIARLPFSKSMRWADHTYTFSRPLRGIAAVFGDRVVPFESHGLVSGRHVGGHRFVSPEGGELAHARDYEDLLARHSVIVDPRRRRELILEELEAACAREGLEWIRDEELLDEVVCLVEHPTLVVGHFDPDFLVVPESVILSAMRKHQRYFAFRSGGRLAPRFATALGTKLKSPPAALAGNQRVLSARLSDARFFWDEDRKSPLEARQSRMENMVYHQKLGTMWDRIGRISVMAGRFAARMDVDAAKAARAALLCKMDLETQMVYEFPDLQGDMGRAYALAQGEDPAVAEAIREHYWPRFAGDQLPATPLGRVLALSDKCDTLCGGIAAGLRPTGSADPFALRRAALGFLRILLENGLDLSLQEVFAESCAGLPLPCDPATVKDFVVDRMRSLFGENHAKEMIESVLAVAPDRPVGVAARLAALSGLAQTDGFNQLVKLYRRMNILKKADAVSERIRPEVLEHPAEKALYESLERVSAGCATMLDAGDFGGALREMVSLWKEVDEFFHEERGVRVMADDPALRENRLALLFRLDALLRRVADFKILAALA